jgi:tetratricopeptide (TPR) repeat protein
VILAALVASLFAFAQKPSEVPPPPPDKPAVEAPIAEPEEEDVAAKPKTYDFNPIQAEKEIKIGNYYLKKGSLKAAMGRFYDASQYNPQSPEAFLGLGEARERLRDKKGAKAAYQKYLELDPGAKNAGEIGKRIKKLG